MTNFAGYPKSITEMRADKTDLAKDITPRDVLIEMLRDIDEGHLNPSAIVVAFMEGTPEAPTMDWRVSSPNLVVTNGILARALYRVNRASEE